MSHVQGRRDERLSRRVLSDGAGRLKNRYMVALMTDGDTQLCNALPGGLRPAWQGARGRLPGLRYRIPRSLAHVQIIKHRVGTRLEEVEIRYTHGSRKRVLQALASLSHRLPNTAIIEQRTGTVRRMSAH